MGERPDTTAEAAAPASESRAVTVQKAREVRVVEDAAPLFDTARFEHYGRIAAVMGTATLIPDALKGESREETVGNCFMVVSMADRLGGFDPWAVAQCCSVVHGKLMLEGKLIAAAIRHKIGIELFTYYTGEKGSPDFRVYLCDREFSDEMIADLEPGKGLRGYRVVDGSVAEWQTFEKDRNNQPGAVKGNWLRQPDLQLYYRGTRVWARRFEPGIMLGVYSDDEKDDLEERHPIGPRQVRGTAEKLTGRGHNGEHGPTGFDRDHVDTETGRDAPKDAEFEDVGGESLQATTGGDAATSATDGAGADLLGVTDEMRAKAAALAKIAPNDDPEADILDRLAGAARLGQAVQDGHAEEAEVYLLAGVPANEANKFLTFKDGTRFSTKANVEGLKVYAIHSAEVSAEEADLSVECTACGAKAGEPCKPDCPGEAEAEDQTDGRPTSAAAPTATDGVQAAEAEPASSDAATSASTDGAPTAEASGRSAPQAGDDQPGVQASGFLGSLRPMTAWADIKVAWGAMMKTSDWISADDTDKNDVRRAVWAEVERVKADHGDPVDHATDATAFSIWMATQAATRDGADAVQGTFDVLRRDESSTWHNVPEGGQAQLTARVDAFLKRGRGQ